jgi:Cu(I)/Ag(I) efflux system membrane protein CusA/SilA
MFFAALLAVTLVPVLTQILLKPAKRLNIKNKKLSGIVNFFWAGKIYSEKEHPISRVLFKIYGPALTWVLKRRKGVILASGLAILSTVPVYMHIGSEFMPPLNEGDILYMPTTLPGISIETAKSWLQMQDKMIKRFGEVETVFGKIGRATTPTDPAPLSMVETVVKLKPYHDWPDVHHDRWYSAWSPSWLKPVFSIVWPEMKPRTWDELIAALNKDLKIPGTTNAWTMPIKTRIDMLSTGIRTPVGIKVYGPSLDVIEDIGAKIEGLLPKLKGTRSAFSERVTGGYFIDFNVRRIEAARYGLTIGDVEDIIETAVSVTQLMSVTLVSCAMIWIVSNVC